MIPWRALLMPLGSIACATAVFSAGALEHVTRDVHRLATCQRIGNKLTSVSAERCLASGLEPGAGWSVEGAPILVREFRPAPTTTEPSGRVLLIAGIHGDEFTAVSVAFGWMKLLETSTDRRIHWRLAPASNPDGLLRLPSERTNAHGVDLNRNFPSPDWHRETREYWVRRTGRNPRRYPGPSPLSEPETRWIARQIGAFHPDVIVSVHAPHRGVDIDGPMEAPPRLGSLDARTLGSYPGSLGRFAGVHSRIPVITIELPSAGALPVDNEQREIWRDLLAWLDEHLSSVRADGSVARR